MYRHTRNDKIMNEIIYEKVGVTSVVDKMKEKRLRWWACAEEVC